MKTNNQLLAELAENWGYTDEMTMIEDYLFDGVMPAICRNDGCGYTTEMEPDQTAGWCENCGTNTVVSAAILAGVI